MQTKTHNNSSQRLLIKKQARDQLGGLSVMFLLGMAVNLIGLPSETKGSIQTITTILVGLHALLGIGLIAGSILTVLRAKSSVFLKLALIGLVIIVFTFFCGVMTLNTENNWWSYAMSVGFLASFWIYGVLFVKARVEQ